MKIVEDHVATPVPDGVPIWDVDPYSTDVLRNPEPFYAELREKGAFVYIPRYAVLACGRYAETRAVFSDWQRFVSSRGVGMADFHLSEPWRAPSLLLESDPPDHTKSRKVMTRVLSPRIVDQLKVDFLAEANRLVDELLEKGSFDAVAELAEVFPVTVFPKAIGLREINKRALVDYGGIAFNAIGPDNELRREWIAKIPDVVPWITDQCSREALNDGGFGAAIYAAADAGEVTEDEAAMLVRSLLSAGVDTTVTALGNAIWCFAQHPDEFIRLKNDPSLVRAAFEEVLRYRTPVHSFYRTANVDTSVGPVKIAKDTKILCFLGSTNLDPQQWPDAERFNIARRPIGHLAFGVGIHGCAGQIIARAEAEAVLTALATKVKSISFCGSPVWRPGNGTRALESLPVKMCANES